MEPYSVYFRIEAVESLRHLSGIQRDRIIRLARALAENPFQRGNSRESDATGRPREIKIIGRLSVVYDVDNAEKEVRIIDIRTA